MALWKGLQQAKEQGIQDLFIVGDSIFIVRAIICQTQTQSAKLNNLLSKIFLLLTSFRSYEIFHVLRKMNEKADVEDNKGVLLVPRSLILSGTVSIVEMP